MRDNSYLTICEIIAIQVLVLYRNRTGKVDLTPDIINSDEKLTACILDAVEWYENTSFTENDDYLFNPYIKKVNEKYLEVVKSEAFLSSYSDNFRKRLMDCNEE